jgi:hypothetical protein
MTDTESNIGTSLRLSKALGLARHGRMDSAMDLLAPTAASPASPLELHALAALVTHEGDFEKALQLWRTLLEKDPGNSEARRMISVIELWVSRPSWFRYLPVAAIVSIAVILGAVFIWALQSTTAPAKSTPAPPPARVAPVAPLPVSPSLAPIKIPATKNQRR